MDVCVDACRDLGAWGEVLAMLLIGARLVWAEVRRHRAERERTDLREQVERLSSRPPADAPLPISPGVPLVLKIEGASLYPDVYRSEAQDSLRPKNDVGEPT